MPSNVRDWQHPVWLLGLQIAALWPHWIWMGRRTADGSDEPWGLIALLTIVVLVIADRKRIAARLPGIALIVAGGLSVLAALSMPHVPPIVAGATAILALVALLSGMLPQERPRAALCCMALLALPLVASLNFYLGYPLRWLCSYGVAAIVSAGGWHVTPEGAALLWNGKTILVDAPCAGIAMLWVGMYAAALMSYLYRASTLRTAFNLALAAVIMVIGNIVRNAALFFKEAGIVNLPDWTHEGIGLAVFSLMCLAMYRVFSWRTDAHR
jgi:exosortase/archaeosortase family protein